MSATINAGRQQADHVHPHAVDLHVVAMPVRCVQVDLVAMLITYQRIRCPLAIVIIGWFPST